MKTKWCPEITNFAPSVPFILVGTKVDLRTDTETLSKLRNVGAAPTTEKDVRMSFNFVLSLRSYLYYSFVCVCARMRVCRVWHCNNQLELTNILNAARRHKKDLKQCLMKQYVVH